MTAKFISWEEAVLWLKGQPDQQELVRACFYDDPLDAAAERYHASTEWLEVQGLLRGRPTRAVLDLGAGRGISSYALARDGWQVTALEPDPSEVVGAGAIRNLAAEKGLSIRVVESWGETLPFPDNNFDLVYARQALHHARDLDLLCREIARVLKPGGMLLATREHVISRIEDLPAFLEGHPLHRLYGGENAFTLERYRQAITGSGIRLTKVLATYASNINLYPASDADVKAKVERKLKMSIPRDVFGKIVVPLLNFANREPGRLYTFIGCKP